MWVIFGREARSSLFALGDKVERCVGFLVRANARASWPMIYTGLGWFFCIFPKTRALRLENRRNEEKQRSRGRTVRNIYERKVRAVRQSRVPRVSAKWLYLTKVMVSFIHPRTWLICILTVTMSFGEI